MKRNWKEAIFEEEYVREKSRAFFKRNAEKEAIQKKKEGLLAALTLYLPPLSVAFLTGYIIFTLRDIFAASLGGIFDHTFFISMGVLVAIFLLALKS